MTLHPQGLSFIIETAQNVLKNRQLLEAKQVRNRCLRQNNIFVGLFKPRLFCLKISFESNFIVE